MRFALALLGPLLVLAPPVFAQSDQRMLYLTRQLASAKDPRVKAQAALMLGASNDPDAKQPLCGGLNDLNEVVRAASAKALGELNDVEAIECLKTRHADPDPTARSAVQRSLERLETIRSRKPEFYIALNAVVDKTDAHMAGDLLRLTENRLRAKLSTMGTVFAPANESRANAKSLIKKKSLKGYMLIPELHSLPNGGLKIHVLCLTYPDRAIMGEVNVKASGGGAADLIRALAPKVIEEAADTFNWSS